MNPFKLNQRGAPRLATLFGALFLISACAFGFLFAREFSTHQQTTAQLVQAEHERARLEEAVAELRREVAGQREEVARLTTELKVASTKAALVETLKAQHASEIARTKQIYADQVSSLRNMLEVRGDLINTFESNLKAIRALLEGHSTARAASQRDLGIQEPFTSQATVSGAAPHPAARLTGSAAGRVLRVNPEHHFIISDLGPADGAREGRTIQIYRDTTLLGQARIDRVYQNLSAATVASEDTLSRAKEGDRVFLTY